MARDGKGKRGPEPPSDTEDGDNRDGLRGKLESMLPDVVRKWMVSGLGAIFMTEEAIRSSVAEMRLPKEAVGFFVQQADQTKEQLLTLIAREVKEALERMDFASELPRLLKNVTIEVKTEIRFKETPEGDMKTEVSSKTTGKSRRRKRPKKSE